MNPHPLIVHFPVALLSLYAIMELVRYKKITTHPGWFYSKALLVVLGEASALVAYLTGDIARDFVRNSNFHIAVKDFSKIVETHETFGKLSILVFGVLAISYLVLTVQNYLTPKLATHPGLIKIWELKLKFARFFADSWFAVVLAILGLVCITITGALGGTMVYGTEIDPVVGWVYNLLIR